MENSKSETHNLIPASAAELEHLIQTLPEERGKKLLEEHWKLLFHEKPGSPGGLSLEGCWVQLQERGPVETGPGVDALKAAEKKAMEHGVWEEMPLKWP